LLHRFGSQLLYGCHLYSKLNRESSMLYYQGDIKRLPGRGWAVFTRSREL